MKRGDAKKPYWADLPEANPRVSFAVLMACTYGPAWIVAMIPPPGLRMPLPVVCAAAAWWISLVSPIFSIAASILPGTAIMVVALAFVAKAMRRRTCLILPTCLLLMSWSVFSAVMLSDALLPSDHNLRAEALSR